MLGPAEILLTYYLGGAFVVLLGWAAYLPDPPLDAGRAQRYLRWSTVAAVAGLAHPALGLAARDVVGQVGQVGQVGHGTPDDARLAPRVARLMASELGCDDAWQERQVDDFLSLARGYLPQ